MFCLPHRVGILVVCLNVWVILCLAQGQPNSAWYDYIAGQEELDEEAIIFLLEEYGQLSLDLNKLRQRDIEKLFFLSANTKAKLWKNRKQIKSLAELQSYCQNETEWQLLQPIVKTVTKGGDFQFYHRSGIQEEAPKGERELQWQGSRWQLMSVFSGSLHNWSFGAIHSKDAGERQLYDNLNAFVRFSKSGWTITAGSFIPRYGYGIIFSAPRFSDYKSPRLHSYAFGAKAYAGNLINLPIYGLSMQWKGRKWQAELSTGRQFFDARCETDGLHLMDGLYHRRQQDLERLRAATVEHLIMATQSRFAAFTIGTVFALSRFPTNMIWQHDTWVKGSHFQSSILFTYPKWRLSSEVRLLPRPAVCLGGRITFTRYELYYSTYLYSGSPSLNGRHLLGNRLPSEDQGLSLRWRQRAEKGSLLGGGYLWLEKRRAKEGPHITAGLSIAAKWLARHEVEMQWQQSYDDSKQPEQRTIIHYRLRMKQRNYGQLNFAAGKMLSGLDKLSSGSYVQIRLQKQLLVGLSLHINAQMWDCQSGSLFRLYRDGLPRTFSLLTTSAKGSALGTMTTWNFAGFRFYYQFTKENFWGAEQISSGENEISGSFRSKHWFGVNIVL
jgi:hypothetical protein